MYTGSGGRDLSGNKRTSKVQSHDQKFDAMNQALKLSCEKGLPVRVVRSYKEKRSAYAPPVETPVRYDGLYRISHCWRKKGAQGMLMCRYLFVRCDNDPAPWSSEGERGDGGCRCAGGPAASEQQRGRQAGGHLHDTCLGDTAVIASNNCKHPDPSLRPPDDPRATQTPATAPWQRPTCPSRRLRR